jgi:pimeloyl-ACP methyl ester carboxylesterase
MEVTRIRIAEDRIAGELRVPKQTKRLIIVCHGYQSSQDNPAVTTKTPLLNELGYATFTFDFSPGKGGIDVAGQVRDILAIIDHFSMYDEIILLGISFAALSTSIAALHSPKVKGVVTLGGFFGKGALRRDYRRKFYLFRALAFISPSSHRIYRYLKNEFQPERISMPVLVIYSTQDAVVYPSQSRAFYDRLQAPKQVLVLESGNHTANSEHDSYAVVDAIHAWIIKTTASQP